MQSCWIRQRQILTVPDKHPWWRSHAQIPMVLPVHDRLWRVYVSGRDGNNHASTVRIDLDPSSDMRVLSISQDHLLAFGAPGAFDSDGIGVTCALDMGDKTVFLSSGMKRLKENPYALGIGLVQSDDHGETLSRVQTDPVLGAGPDHPFGCGVPHVVRMGGLWHMWFSSMRRWERLPGCAPDLRYDIRHAVSSDLRTWDVDPGPSLALSSPKDGGLLRPWVSATDQGFEMWYSRRGRFDANAPLLRNYAIGYATSTDGTDWTRRDDLHGFVNPAQPGDWDFDMQCYATVVDWKGESYMFYCGNGYGHDGFGYAIRDKGQ